MVSGALSEPPLDCFANRHWFDFIRGESFRKATLANRDYSLSYRPALTNPFGSYASHGASQRSTSVTSIPLRAA